ncbi:MAG TPA: hypothetical protein VNI02_00085, partial [Blastocatellia bacterium]|nr:hypothetical protein [Blastocatellia bacterium]
MFKRASESPGPMRSLQASRAYLLEISGSVTGGQLQMEFRYSRNKHRRSSIEHLAGLYMQSIRALISHSHSAEPDWFTPSDFPAANVDQDELDELIAEITQTIARKAE